MRKILTLFFLITLSYFSSAQVPLTYNGQTWSSSNTGYYGGLSISRTVPTALTFTNNLYTTVNSSGYQLVAGDELAGSTNNNLDGAIITGNRFIWNGTDVTSETHGLFTGYNKNVIIKYNYLYRVPNAIPRKSSGMHNTSGGVAYNIIVDPDVGVVAKGMNDVKIYNNTFYSKKTQTDTWKGMIDIHINDDEGQNAPSTGTKIFNNIFYTIEPRININIYEAADLAGFESDYNIYYCKNGVPHFQIGTNIYSYTEWKALGYDAHSQLINPNFIDTISFVPSARMDFGTDLGSEFQAGLARDAVIGFNSPATTDQNGTWQVGARIYAAAATPVTGISVTGAGGSSSITINDGTLQLTPNISPAGATDQAVVWSITNGTGQATISSSGLVTAVANGTVTAKALAHDGSGKSGTLVITISNQITPVTSISVTGTGGVSTITTDKGTLQLIATVLPAGATIKTVTWTLADGTGHATISGTGLVSALSSGTVTARATATDGSGVYGTMVITISNQAIPVTSITVTGAGGATTIATDNGTLQLNAAVLPANASNQNVVWSVTSGTGQATINGTGLVTAISNGTVTARATAADGSNVVGSLVITISNQTIPVTSITVTGAGGASGITTDNGTLQLNAAVLPANASNTNVNWTITAVTGQATISATGLVTAVSDGSVTARATAADGSGIYGTLLINISNQFVPVTGILVTGAGGATIITTDNGTLQLTAAVSPSNATNKAVTWTITDGTGHATISSSGLVTAVTDGTVNAWATASDGSGIFGTLIITIASQTTPVTSISVTGAGGATSISSDNGTLQMNASVLPADATDKSVTWTVTPGTGEASIGSGGLLTAISNGTVTVVATANDGSGMYGSLVITISNQVVPVSSISVTGEGGATAIFNDNGTLQLSALVLPANATNKSITWTVENGTGEATIDQLGLLCAINNGTVTARASATDGSGVYGTLLITISGQVIPVTEINVSGEGGANTITEVNGQLQLNAEVLPDDATNKSVSWSVASGSGSASINSEGLVTAINAGTVTAQASANDGSGVSGTLNITIGLINQKQYSIIVNSDEIRIIFYEDFVGWIGDLYDFNGHHAMRHVVESNELVFSTRTITPGLYLIVLSRGENLLVEKVMVK